MQFGFQYVLYTVLHTVRLLPKFFLFFHFVFLFLNLSKAYMRLFRVEILRHPHLGPYACNAALTTLMLVTIIIKCSTNGDEKFLLTNSEGSRWQHFVICSGDLLFCCLLFAMQMCATILQKVRI